MPTLHLLHMLCSIPTFRIRGNHLFPSASSFYFSGPVVTQDYTEESRRYEFVAKTPSQNPTFYSHSPIVRLSGNPARSSDFSLRSQHKISHLPESWARRKMKECATTGNFLEAMHYLSFLSPTILDYNALFYYYLKQRRISVDLLVHVFLGMKRFGPFPNVWTFNILFNGLCALGFLHDSFSVIKEMCRNKFAPSFSLLKKLLKKSLRSGMFDLSHKVLILMLRYGYEPTLPALNSLISGFSSSGKLREANSIFWMMIEKGFLLNVCSYNPILSSLCKSRQIPAALAFSCSLRKRGFVLNAYSYTSLILGFSSEGLWDDAYYVLNLMQINGCAPTVVTYTVLIKSLCKYNCFEDALRIYDEMKKKGCSPDQITYNVLLHALCSCNKFMDAIKLVDDMLQKACCPDQFTYCTVAACMLRAGHVRESGELLFSVLETNNDADAATWNVYFHGLCYDNRVQEASALLMRKMEEGFVPTKATYNTILKGLCMEKKLDEALGFLDRCEWGGEGPDVISFNTILSAACDAGYSSMIRRILHRMEVEGTEPNIITLTCLMQYFGRIGELSSCYGLFRCMINHECMPTTVTYNVLMGILSRKKMIQNMGGYISVRCLLASMYRRRLFPDEITYALLSSCLCRTRRISAALRLEYVMSEHEMRPRISFYNAIMDAMFREGRLGDVYRLLRKMKIEGIEANEASNRILNRALSKGGRKRFPKAMIVLENLMRNGANMTDMENR